jgi:hypothetical protein
MIPSRSGSRHSRASQGSRERSREVSKRDRQSYTFSPVEKSATAVGYTK